MAKIPILMCAFWAHGPETLRQASKEAAVAGDTVRFIQASDFNLQQPLDVAGCSSAACATLARAPQAAATRVFDWAIQRQVDFLLLAGNIADPRGIGAGGYRFLLDQFTRLETAEIPVYWALGNTDRARRWPAAITWPTNVHRFQQPSPTAKLHRRNGDALVDIVGASWTANRHPPVGDFSMDRVAPHAIVLSGNLHAGISDVEGTNLWCLGGREESGTQEMPPTAIHYSGTPQSRGFENPGAHGCTLVELTTDAPPLLEFLDCDAVRFYCIDIRSHAASQGLSQRDVESELERYVHKDGEQPFVIKWRLSGTTESAMPDTGLPTGLADPWHSLHSRFPSLLGQVFESDSLAPPEHIPEDSLRASYLQCLADMMSGDEIEQVLSDAAGEQLPSELAAFLSRNASRDTSTLARRAAEVGQNLLGQQTPSEPIVDDREVA